ncbi:MAG: cyclic nucleotide-binding domain-containing protein [Bacteroidota bacterium]
MDTDFLKAELTKFNPAFTEEELNLGLPFFEKKTYQAKDEILKNGDTCKYLFIAESSITRCYYYDHEGKEQTLWMKPEKTLITEYKSFVHEDPSQFSLQFYEDTTVYRISRHQLKTLYAQSNAWAQFGVFLTEHVHITLIDVFVNLLANDATSNYQYIEYAFPRFIQVAPLKDIASMLQVSQVTLSRIRAGKQLKDCS